MTTSLIDLHTHSTASDGTDSPALLVKKAKEAGLAALALTDHDTIAGLDEAEEASRQAGIKFIRGCEISTATDQGNMHILGLWLPKKCEPLETFLKNLRDGRDKRNDMIIERLQAAGIKITLEEVQTKAGTTVGRPHIAALLVEKGYVKDSDEAFSVWLAHNGKAYVPKPAPRPEQAIRMLRELGASPILAHPLLRPKPKGWLEKTISEMKNYGLFGLEAWHSAFTPQQMNEIVALAKKYDLALSGGSDYHGKNKPLITLGTGKNNLAVPSQVLENLEKRRAAQGLPC